MYHSKLELDHTSVQRFSISVLATMSNDRRLGRAHHGSIARVEHFPSNEQVIHRRSGAVEGRHAAAHHPHHGGGGGGGGREPTTGVILTSHRRGLHVLVTRTGR